MSIPVGGQRVQAPFVRGLTGSRKRWGPVQEFGRLFERNPLPMYVSSFSHRKLLAVNRSMLQCYGYTEQEFLRLGTGDLLFERDPGKLAELMGATAHPSTLEGLQRRHRKKDGTPVDVEVWADDFIFGHQRARLVVVYDVTERLHTERELARIGRAQRMLSACNEAMLRVDQEMALLQRVCGVAVEIGGYVSAFVAYARHDAAKSVDVVAEAGKPLAYLKSVPLSWNPDDPRGNGSIGLAIRGDKPVVVDDIAAHRGTAGHAEPLVALGLRSSVSLPLRSTEGAFGALCLSSSEPRSIGAQELALLEQLADDLAVGLNTLRAQETQRRARAERDRVHAAVAKVAAGLSAPGAAFFVQLAANMVDALGAQAGLVGRLLPGPQTVVRAVGAVVGQQVQPAFDLQLAGSLCENIQEADEWRMTAGAGAGFFAARWPAACGADAFVARRLDNAAGQPIGLVVVAFSGGLGHLEFVASTVRIFATRAAAEMERQEADARIQKLAFYDALTGLPNRLQLWERLQQALDATERGAQGAAILLIDLDHFKTINDTWGHDKGDLLLQEVAARLQGCVRETDTVARLGGDEFVVLLTSLPAGLDEVAAQARTTGENILARLGSPYWLEGVRYQDHASIGIAPFAGPSGSVNDLLKQAEIAMYEAKAAGRQTLRFFDQALQAAVTARAELEADLRQALVHQEFLLHYQCQFNSAGQAIGVEALVRWRNPRRGLVSPDEFIPVCEETGLILALGQQVLDMACGALAAWRGRAFFSGLTVAVNVSPRQFRSPDFVGQVAAALARSAADPRRLKLELTESTLVEDMDAVVEKMTVLKAMGVRFSLDDFGTGYSSLSYLKRLPLDQLKIDQSFVRDVLSDPDDAAIVQSVIALGRSFGLQVIAEGVEVPAQSDFLARHGCHAYQGYLFGRPLALDALEAFLGQS
jgi:diguanylate cyclase (GGDEF)-like protein/PAS domain S-box-containing protein